MENSSATTHIVLVEAEPITRFGLRYVLEKNGLVVIQETDSLPTIGSDVDLLILDPDDHPDPVGVVTRLFETTADLDILFFTRKPLAADQTVAAFEAGIRGIVLKTAPEGDLLQAVQNILLGNFWFPGTGIVRNLNNHLGNLRKGLKLGQLPAERYGITPRELEVIECLLEGMGNKDIAVKYNISEETVKRHMSNVFDKTGVSTRLEMALFALHHKLSPRYCLEVAA